MTIGIATILSDRVVLIADGRESYFKEGSIVTDDKNKIINIGNNFALISTGVSEITEYALRYIRLNFKTDFNIEQICELVDCSLKIAWKKKSDKLPQDIDLDNPKIHSTFLVGGIIKNQPFITAIARNYNSYYPYLIAKEPIQFLIGCHEKIKAENFYEEQLFKYLGDEELITKLADINNRIIKCGTNTVRFMEKMDSSIGGKIHYSIISYGESYIADVSNE